MLSQEDFEEGKHSAALFFNPKDDMVMAAHGDDFVRSSDDEGLKHVDKRLMSKFTAKDMGTHGFEDSDAKSLLLFEPCVSSWDRGQYLDIELDLRHAPLYHQRIGMQRKDQIQ